MKKTVLVIIGIMIYGMNIFAQNKDFNETTPEKRAQIHTQWMEKTLVLNSKQVEQVKPINLRFAKEMEKIKLEDKSKIQKLKAVREIDELRISEFKSILTPTQLDTYNDKKKELFKMVRQKGEFK